MLISLLQFDTNVSSDFQEMFTTARFSVPVNILVSTFKALWSPLVRSWPLCFAIVAAVAVVILTNFRQYQVHSVMLVTLFLGKSPRRQFTNTLCISFHQSDNQQKRENGLRNVFMAKSPQKNVSPEEEIRCIFDDI